MFKKNLNAAKSPEQSKGLGGTLLAVRTKTQHGTQGFPNVKGQQCNVGEKPTLLFYLIVSIYFLSVPPATWGEASGALQVLFFVFCFCFCNSR